MMTSRQPTKAEVVAAVNHATKFTVLELPFDLKDQAKAERIQVEARDAVTRARSTSVAVIVLDLPRAR